MAAETRTAQDREQDIVSPFDMLMNRSTCGYAVRKMNVTFAEGKGPLKAADVTIGIQDADELQAYADFAYDCAEQHMFRPEDNQEVAQLVADYCQNRDLTVEEMIAAHKVRIAMAEGLNEETKDGIDRAIFDYGRKAQSRTGLSFTKKLLGTIAVKDRAVAKSGDVVDAGMNAGMMAWILSTPKGRTDLEEAFYQGYERKFAPSVGA